MNTLQTARSTPRPRAPRRTASSRAPISAALRKQLALDCASPEAVQAAARRFGDAELSMWEARDEHASAKEHFELGCWLIYFAPRVYAREGLQDRIDCALKLFRAGVTNPGYQFFTVFRFGERDFDTIFEMGDADAVVAALWQAAEGDSRLTDVLTHVGIRRQ